MSMILISIANRHYNTQKKYACHMKVILDTKSEKGNCIDYCFVFVYFNVAVPHVVIICQKYLVKFQ